MQQLAGLIHEVVQRVLAGHSRQAGGNLLAHGKSLQFRCPTLHSHSFVICSEAPEYLRWDLVSSAHWIAIGVFLKVSKTFSYTTGCLDTRRPV